MKRTIIILYVFLSGASPYAQSQENIESKKLSYLILHSQDTLFGKISIDIKGHAILKNKVNKIKETYSPAELVGYVDVKKGNTYITIDPADDNHGPWLYQRKTDDIIKFYSYTFVNSNGGKLPYYYIEKGD